MSSGAAELLRLFAVAGIDLVLPLPAVDWARSSRRWPGPAFADQKVVANLESVNAH